MGQYCNILFLNGAYEFTNIFSLSKSKIEVIDLIYHLQSKKTWYSCSRKSDEPLN
jgi:hypothetical protein